jgi:hypothetical protein
MNTISPISNPDDIRKESEENKPVGPHPELAPSDSQPTATVSADGSMPDPLAVTPAPLAPVNTEAQPVVMPLSVNQPQAQTQPSQPSPVTPSQGASSIYPSVAQPSPFTTSSVSDAKTTYGFEYKLPLSSYLISLLSVFSFYNVVIVPIVTVLMIASAFGFSTGASSPPNIFTGEILKEYGPYVSFLLLAVFILIPRKWARWAAMVVAGGMILYALYSLFTANQQSGGVALEVASKVDIKTYFYLFMVTLPYIIAPLVTIPYLLTPKASRAYS